MKCVCNQSVINDRTQIYRLLLCNMQQFNTKLLMFHVLADEKNVHAEAYPN